MRGANSEQKTMLSMLSNNISKNLVLREIYERLRSTIEISTVVGTEEELGYRLIYSFSDNISMLRNSMKAKIWTMLHGTVLLAFHLERTIPI